MVSWGRLTEKHMPRLYTPSVQAFFEKLWKARGARYLRDYIANGAYGVLPPGDSYASDLPIKFVRSAELTPNLGIDLEACPQVATEYFIPKARAHKDDILLAVKGATIASKKSVAHVREDIGDAIVNGSIFRMRAREGVNPRLLAIALSSEFAKRQMKLGLVANNGVDYLDKTLIHKIVVPLPELNKQNELVHQYDTSAANAELQYRQADALLASTDDCLLAELGIALPPEPDNTIGKRMFRTKASDLGGWRFDARVHQYDFNMHSSTYPNAKLGTICAINPKTVFRGLSNTDEVSFVPMDAISDRLGTIEKREKRVLAENVAYTSFREGDLLWAKITPCMENGKSAVAESLQIYVTASVPSTFSVATSKIV